MQGVLEDVWILVWRVYISLVATKADVASEHQQTVLVPMPMLPQASLNDLGPE